MGAAVDGYTAAVLIPTTRCADCFFIAMAGPLVGSLGALAFFFAGRETGNGLLLALAYSGFMINLSGDNPAHADSLADLGIAPVVTVLGRAYARRAVRHRFKRRRDEWAETIGEWRNRTASLPRYTPAGRRIAVCPATYSDATCKSCGACARVRDAVIGFPAHGAWRQVEAAMAARDVPAGESWGVRWTPIVRQPEPLLKV